MRDPPDPRVVIWVDRQASTELWMTAVTVFEVRYGLARMTTGRKRAQLDRAFGEMLREEFAGRVALLDQAAADEAGRLAARREVAGRSVDVRDTLIGGIALARRARMATRNIRHFEDLGTGILNPWTD